MVPRANPWVAVRGEDPPGYRIRESVVGQLDRTVYRIVISG
jgi:hypothetical protein